MECSVRVKKNVSLPPHNVFYIYFSQALLGVQDTLNERASEPIFISHKVIEDFYFIFAPIVC